MLKSVEHLVVIMATPNTEFYNESAANGGANVKLCFQCGTCTAGCPSGQETAYRTRKVMRMAQLGLKDDLTLTQLFRMSDVFSVQKVEGDENELWSLVSVTAQEALDSFIEMRAIEGERLKNDILSKLDFIEETVGKIETRSPDVTKEYRTKLYTRLCDLLGDKNIDESRILTEAAIFADKTAVDEETVRLRSHIAQYRELLTLDEPIGKKLDFLIQEMNREVNTTGSKCSDLTITRMVVDLKSTIEKIREQIQNIE